MTELTPEELAEVAAYLDRLNALGMTNVMNGTLRNVHPRTACQGRTCWVHNPSEHSLSQASVYWDEVAGRAHRVCEHGRTHVDPDDANYRVVELGHTVESTFAHDCDGCCDLGKATLHVPATKAEPIDPDYLQTTVRVSRPIDVDVDILRQMNGEIVLDREDDLQIIGEFHGWAGLNIAGVDVWDAADAISSDAEILGAAAGHIIASRPDLSITSVVLANRFFLDPQFRGQRLTGLVIEDLVKLLRLEEESTLVVLCPEPQQPDGGPMPDGPARDAALQHLCDAYRESGLEPWAQTHVWWKPIPKTRRT